MANDRWRDDDRQRWEDERDGDRYGRESRYSREGSGREGSGRESSGRQDFSRQDYGRRDYGRQYGRDDGSRRDYGRDYSGQDYGRREDNPSYGQNYGGQNWGRGDYGSGYSGGQNWGRGDYGSGGSHSGYGYGGYGSSNYSEPSRGRDWGSGHGGSDQQRYGGDYDRDRYWGDRYASDRYSDYYAYPDYGYGMGMAWSAGLAEWPAPIADSRSGSAQDWRRAQNYRDPQSYRDYRGARGGYGNERGWWDRTKDEVRSWMGDEEAERRRRMDSYNESRRASHFGRGPKGYARSDTRILEDVSDRLTEDWRVDASEIEVVVVSAEVTLTGMVDSRDVKRRAENIAADVTGVKDVQNNLRVRQQQTPQSTGQSTLTGSSSSALEQTTGLSSGAQTNSTATRPKH